MADERKARADAERERDLAELRRQIAQSNFEVMLSTTPLSTEMFVGDEDAKDRLISGHVNVEVLKDKYQRLVSRIERMQRLASEFSNDVDIKYDLATTRATLAIWLARLGEIDLVIEELKIGVTLTNEARDQTSLARSSDAYDLLGHMLGRLLKYAGRSSEALSYSHSLGLALGPDKNLYIASRTRRSVI